MCGDVLTLQPVNGGGPARCVPVVNADADGDSVSSDSGRGPSEDEYRACSSSLQSQQLTPTARLMNGTLYVTYSVIVIPPPTVVAGGIIFYC